MTKVRQAVTDATKTQMDPTLKQALRQFEETKNFGGKIKDAMNESLLIIGTMSKHCKVETLSTMIKPTAAKYGLDKQEAQGLSQGGELLMEIGQLERALLQKVDRNVYPLIKSTHEFYENLNKQKTKLEQAMVDMDGAKIKLKSGKGDLGRAESLTRGYQTQLANVEQMVSTLLEYRDKQRQDAKAFAKTLHEFYTLAAQVIEQKIASLG